MRTFNIKRGTPALLLVTNKANSNAVEPDVLLQSVFSQDASAFNAHVHKVAADEGAIPGLEAKGWSARKNLTFTDEHVRTDPMKLESYGITACGYDANSPAEWLGKNGWIVFSNVPKGNSAHLLAVQYSDIEVNEN